MDGGPGPRRARGELPWAHGERLPEGSSLRFVSRSDCALPRDAPDDPSPALRAGEGSLRFAGATIERDRQRGHAVAQGRALVDEDDAPAADHAQAAAAVIAPLEERLEPLRPHLDGEAPGETHQLVPDRRQLHAGDDRPSGDGLPRPRPTSATLGARLRWARHPPGSRRPRSLTDPWAGDTWLAEGAGGCVGAVVASRSPAPRCRAALLCEPFAPLRALLPVPSDGPSMAPAEVTGRSPGGARAEAGGGGEAGVRAPLSHPGGWGPGARARPEGSARKDENDG